MQKQVLGLAIALALGGAVAPLHAMAWGAGGHRAVGAIAGQLIQGANAQRQVAALLQADETLESVSLWADCAKGTYCGPQTAEMREYAAANPQHGAYHYADIPFQRAHYHDGDVGSTDHDIVQTLKQAIAVLQGRADAVANPHRFSRRQALLLLVHLAGDIHQPLHVGAAYVRKDGRFAVPLARCQIDAVNIFDTRGGNDLLLDDARLAAASAEPIAPAPPGEEGDAAAFEAGTASEPKPAGKPFHAYWDTTLVDDAMHRVGARTPQQFARIVIGGQPAVATDSGAPANWPYQWADDALRASKLAYAGVTPGLSRLQSGKKGDIYRVWALHVPSNYPVSSSALAKAQLIKAGYRLAALLQAIWP